MTLTPKNWGKFQHYKDRNPPWNKLHRTLLDQREYNLLSPLAGKCLPLVWLVAAERNGLLPSNREIAFRLRISEPDIDGVIEELISLNFLTETETTVPAEHDATQSQQVAKANGFGSRHIADQVKRVVWKGDGGKCCRCGSKEDLEYDRKTPVSKGGSSDLDNIQLLCRPCNRSKRVRVATHAQPSQDRRSLETETETETEAKKKEPFQEGTLSERGDSRAPRRRWAGSPSRAGR